MARRKSSSGGSDELQRKTEKLTAVFTGKKPKLTYQWSGKIDIKFTGLAMVSKQVDAGIASADKIVQTGLSKALEEALTSSVWDWSGVVRKTPGVTTNRVNGSTVSTPRNIIDTGYLLKHQRVSVKNGDINVANRAEYGWITHEGGYIRPYGNLRAQKAYLPPRPWMRTVLFGGGPIERYPIPEIYTQEIAKQFK